MTEKTKQKKDQPKSAKKPLPNVSDKKEKEQTIEKGTWSEDQKEKSYYYDDSHGYEVYNPDADDED